MLLNIEHRMPNDKKESGNIEIIVLFTIFLFLKFIEKEIFLQ